MSAEHILDMAREVEAGVKARAAARVSQGELRTRERALTEALLDMHSGWKYIRRAHGDLYGVGWDRAQEKAEAALALPGEPDAPKRGCSQCGQSFPCSNGFGFSDCESHA